ncbi:MAG: hypothetical protein WBA07_15775, partial [Rivularia sp. (in: cyanobacteria)]
KVKGQRLGVEESGGSGGRKNFFIASPALFLPFPNLPLPSVIIHKVEETPTLKYGLTDCL